MEIRPFSPNLGAYVSGIDLAKGISDEQFEQINKAFMKFQVLFFVNQNDIPPEIQINLGKAFGELHSHPAAPTMKGYPEIFEIHTHKTVK